MLLDKQAQDEVRLLSGAQFFEIYLTFGVNLCCLSLAHSLTHTLTHTHARLRPQYKPCVVLF